MLASYAVSKDAKAQWRRHLVAIDKKVIARSGEGYSNEADCMTAIAWVKSSAHAPVHKRVFEANRHFTGVTNTLSAATSDGVTLVVNRNFQTPNLCYAKASGVLVTPVTAVPLACRQRLK